MNKYILLLLAAVVALPACHRCDKANHYYERPITKRYVPHYNNGSYFVYQNALDVADIDTFYVRSYSDSMVFDFTETKCDGDYYQTVKFLLVSSRQNDTITCSVKAGPNDDQYYLSGTYRGLRLVSSFSVENGNNNLIVSAEYDKTVTTLPDYTVLGNSYADVAELSAGWLFQKSNEPIVFYYAANIGIIQFSTFDQSNNMFGSTYLLKSYVL